MPPISVILCAKDEEARIGRALDAIIACAPDELIIVDGGSRDGTATLAEAACARLPHARLIRSGGRGLAYDRQLGANAANNPLICFIDADHRPQPGDLESLAADLDHFGLDIVQAGLAIEDHGFWCRAENDAMIVFHRRPGPRAKIVGTAPAIFKRDVLQETPFDQTSAIMGDDADLFRRIEAAGIRRFGIGRTIIRQEHHGGMADYVRKFRWYGRRDAAFMRKHPDRAASMLFHLAVRYPIIRPLMAVLKGRPRAVLYFQLAGVVRLAACLQAQGHAMLTAREAS